MGAANYDVVVVGAGPAGITAAIGLAKAEFSVLVLEAAPFPGAESWSGCVYFAETLANPELLGLSGVEGLAWERRLIERGIFSTNGHSTAGLSYRDPGAFRGCYTVLRPIFDHHLALVARQRGVTVLGDTTAEGLIRERGRIIGVSTQRGPIYADLVFLAEGDAAHLVTKEGYERSSPGRQDPHFLQGIKQVIEMPAGAIEEIFAVGPEEGVAYELLLRNGTFHGRSVLLNMGGFLYTNRTSISLGLVLPLSALGESFDGDPHVLMEWFRGLPEIRRWTRGGRPGPFGAKLIRAGGIRDLPHLVDHGLAIGGAATGLGLDFPYPNFTGPATSMGRLLAQAAIAIRREGGSFSLEELQRHYVSSLESTHWWDDAYHLRRWPAYVHKTRFFFGQYSDAVLGTLHVWTRTEASSPTKWWRWVRMLRRAMPPRCWTELRKDAGQMFRALGLSELSSRRAVWQVFLDGSVNALRDLLGRQRRNIKPSGQLRFHFSVAGGTEPFRPLPNAVADWSRRLRPVLSCAAREVYRNDPVPLRRKLSTTLELLFEQINLLDTLAVAALALGLAATAAIQATGEWLRKLLRLSPSRAHVDLFWDRHAAAVEQVAEITGLPTAPFEAIAGNGRERWEDKLGRLSYESTKDSHIKLFWPLELKTRSAVGESSVWHVCPAKVYECHTGSDGQVRLVVNHENCIKCESCWRASPLVDWARNGAHRLIYRVESPVVRGLLSDFDRAMQSRPCLAKARDWWSPLISRVAQRPLPPEGGDELSDQVHRLARLGDQIARKLYELDRSLAGEPRTIDKNRKRWIETLATYAQQLIEALVNDIRQGPLALTAGCTELHDTLVELSASLQAKMAEVARRAYDGQLFWTAADGRQIVGHHLEGLRRLLDLAQKQLRPVPPKPLPSAGWLAAENAQRGPDDFRTRLEHTLDEAFDSLAWRELDQGAPPSAPQADAIREICQGLHAAGTGGASTPWLAKERKAVFAELGRRDPSLGYLVASHLWARDCLDILGGSAFEEILGRLQSGELAAFAYEGTVEVDRDDEGSRLRGQKIFVPTALAEWFVLVADDQLIGLHRETPGLRIEPLGTLGMRGAGPATLVFDNVPLPTSRCRVDRGRFDQLWAIISSVDVAGICSGMAERLRARAIEHATGRVQFPGLFLDDDFRDAIGKFGAVKKMLAQIAAGQYLIDTMLHYACPSDLSEEGYRRALDLKLVTTEALGTAPGSITYNVTQLFGGTGYSEEDLLPKYYRDAATLRMLGVPNAQATARRGQELLARWEGAIGCLDEIDEPALYDQAAARKALQRELDMIRRVRHSVETAVAQWCDAMSRDPQGRSLADTVADGLARRQAELVATQALLLRTHARLETGLPAQLHIELVRTWLQDVLDSTQIWLEGMDDPECRVALPSVQPDELQPELRELYEQMLQTPSKYCSGDYLIYPFDPHSARYVPELARCDAKLNRYDQELDELFRVRYRERSFDGLSYERHVERQHRLDPEDLELFRDRGFLRMYIPRELGGMGASKAQYNLLIKNLISSGDVGQALTVQANCSIGTVPVLLALHNDLPRASKDIAEFQDRAAERSELEAAIARALEQARRAGLTGVRGELRKLSEDVTQWVGSRPALRSLFHCFRREWQQVGEAMQRYDVGSVVSHLQAAEQAYREGNLQVEEFAEELRRRERALRQFLQWIVSGQMTAFALTEPSAGSDTARVATRAVLRSVELTPEPDGSFRFVAAADGPDRHLINADRIEFRSDGAYYRWSDQEEPARIMFDEYDYDAYDSDRPRYYVAGQVKVPFHDIAQIRRRNGKQCYDYWELNGAKMWLTNARMCGVMVLYARTEQGVTGFFVDRHTEGLLVGKDEHKMGQQASVTNELGLQSVRVPRENMVGLEGRGQVNALEALNAGRAGLTTSTTTSVDNLLTRAERFASLRFGQIPSAIRQRLEEMAEIQYCCEALAYELVGRGDHPQTRSIRMEAAVGKMLTSEWLLRVIELCEEIYGLEGHTTLHNLEKHKRDGRIITVYEGTNEVQRGLILKDLVRELWPRMSKERSEVTGSSTPTSDQDRPSPVAPERIAAAVGALEAMKGRLGEQLGAAVTAFGDGLWANPNMQSVCFNLSEAAAFIKAADSVLGRCAWVLQNLDLVTHGTYVDWSVGITRRAVARLRHSFELRLEKVADSLAALHQGSYPPEIRAASLMMQGEASRDEPGAVGPQLVTRPMQIVVVVQPIPSVSPRPALFDGHWNEMHYRLDSADAAALARARCIVAGATAPVRVVVIGVGPRRAAKVLEEALAAGAHEAILVVSDPGSMSSDAEAAALAEGIRTHCAGLDLLLARTQNATATAGLLGELVAAELGLQYLPDIQAITVRLTEEESTAHVRSTDSNKLRPLTLPAGLGIHSEGKIEEFTIGDFLDSLERPVNFIPWPSKIPKRPVRLVSQAETAKSDEQAAAQPITAHQAAEVLRDVLGLETGTAAQPDQCVFQGEILTAESWTVRQGGAVVLVARSDPDGRLYAADRRPLRVASALACRAGQSLEVLLLAEGDQEALRRGVSELAQNGASSVVLGLLDHTPDPRNADRLSARILTEHWRPEPSTISAVVAGLWADPALARLADHQGELLLRTSEVAGDSDRITLRATLVQGKVDIVRELGQSDPRPFWITVTDSAACQLAQLQAVDEPHVQQWTLNLSQVPSQHELIELLESARQESGVARLTDADFIVDVGFGIGSQDGFEQVIVPLEQALRDLGVRSISLGATRKVTDELKILPPSQQIGQTGLSVNPIILLAIGVSGAPQHLTYIGPRATILAFNRDSESPIMTLGRRQFRPRVFPIVGDLFQTVPAFTAALREAGAKATPSAEPALAG